MKYKFLFFIFVNGTVNSFEYKISKILPEIKARMKYSWKENNPIKLEDLRYLKLSYFGFDNKVHMGELIIHKKLAKEVIEIFKELFNAKYPIEKMKLIDEYKADDESSCADNNTSSFCSRPITGTLDKWSLHSYGIAIDINPKYNPYVKGDILIPKCSRKYLDRTINLSYIIKQDDICYKAFVSRGWQWGGNWQSRKDYHHFQKQIFK